MPSTAQNSMQVRCALLHLSPSPLSLSSSPSFVLYFSFFGIFIFSISSQAPLPFHFNLHHLSFSLFLQTCNQAKSVYSAKNSAESHKCNNSLSSQLKTARILQLPTPPTSHFKYRASWYSPNRSLAHYCRPTHSLSMVIKVGEKCDKMNRKR